ncbi:GTP-binding protein 10-like [Amphibalanus amphitrite]|uniref:GTP-binding protein 10-like n=1 Tax=Amphibalanus amphitrite TaxID=1232801 RepID=UPI001C905F54|nr:GTP-binding protein 10-like [Amphibalanus amphitrite]
MKPRTKFIDKLFVYMKGGAGGNGLPKLNGIGGKGGDVWITAKENQTLRKLKLQNPSQRFTAGVGEHSRKFRIQGEPGEDRVIHVPPGVQVSAADGTVIGDCNVAGDRVLGARGGDGGGPHTGYIGRPGTARQLYLTLKLIADVGLVGFPNAGKSTLLRAVSRARPKVASYPFTTMSPEIGIIHYSDMRQISVADLPGLIEGASRNIGLGHSFLRHVERTQLLLFVVDVNGFQLSPDRVKRSAFETIAILNREIELYKPELLDKPAMLVVNKMDSPAAAETWPELKRRLAEGLEASAAQLPADLRPRRPVQFDHVVPISARCDPESVERVKAKVRACLDIHAAPPPDLEEVHRRMRTGGVVALHNRTVDMEHDRGHRRRQPRKLPQLA